MEREEERELKLALEKAICGNAVPEQLSNRIARTADHTDSEARERFDAFMESGLASFINRL